MRECAYKILRQHVMYFLCVNVNHFEDGMDESDDKDGDEASTDKEYLRTNCNLAGKILHKKTIFKK